MSKPDLSTAARGYLRTPDDAPGFWQLGNLWRIVASGYQTGGSLCAIDQLVTDEGGGPGVHLHPSDEGLYVVSGHCTFYAGGNTVSAAAGSMVFVPRFTEHAFEVDAPETQLLNFYLPAGFELFVMGIAHPAERNGLPRPGEATMPPVWLVEQLSRDFGQIMVPGQPLPATAPPDPSQMITSANPDAAAQPYLATGESSRRWWHEGELWSALADGARTHGSFSMFDIASPHGAGAPPHRFVASDLFYYVIDGTGEMLIEDVRHIVKKGDFVFVPKGGTHARRTTSDTARLLLVITPAGFERVLGMFGARAEAGAAQVTAPTAGNGGLWSALGRGRDPSDEPMPESPLANPHIDARRVAFLLADLGIRPVAMTTSPMPEQSSGRAAE